MQNFILFLLFPFFVEMVIGGIVGFFELFTKK